MIATQESIASYIRENRISQAELSKRSGVSRVQISRIVNRRVGRIQAGTLVRLAEALGIGQDLRSSDPIGQYRQLVIQRLGYKSFAGLGLPDLPEQSLEAIFVPPIGVRQTEKSDGCAAEVLASNVARERYSDAVAQSNPTLAEGLIVANPRVVVLGCPGAGKTTVLQHCAVATAKGEFLGANCLPIFVRLPEFAAALEINPGTDFFSWVIARSEDLGCRGLTNELKAWLSAKDKSVLFLFDGLDEVATEANRRKLVEATLQFVARHPGHRFCIASRAVGFDEAPWLRAGFEVIRLVEYGDAQIDRAIQQWSRAFSRRKSESLETIVQNLQQSIRENPRVRQIAANPLILTILIFLCRSRGYVLPRRRVDLYAKVAEVFLESWEASKRTDRGFSDTWDIDLDSRELCWLVAELALQMQRAGLVLAKRWWVAQRLEEALVTRIGLGIESAKDATERILRFVSHRTGLLEERALDLFAFSHRTMQEYFAAVGAINEAESSTAPSLSSTLRCCVYHPDWSEVIRLTAAQVTPLRAEELIRVILDDPDPSGRLLYRGPLLAARCLLDGTTVANRRVVEQLFRSFEGLGRSKWLGISFEAILLLKQLTRTRHGDAASAALESILHDARLFLADEEYTALVLAARSPERAHTSVQGVDGQAACDSAVLEIRVCADQAERRMQVPNLELLSEDRERWHDLAVGLMEANHVAVESKRIAISQMGLEASVHKRSRIRLKHILRTSVEPAIRAAAAHSLTDCTAGRGSAKSLLVRLMETDESAQVRAACARALVNAAAGDVRLQRKLANLLRQATTEDVRAAAASALHGAVSGNCEIAEELLETARTNETPRLQIACLNALEPLLGGWPELQAQFRVWASGSDVKARVACQLLAEAYARGDLAWDSETVGRTEEVLRSLGSENNFGVPCPHALWALRAIVDAREEQYSVRLEAVLADRLETLTEKLDWAFVFGSVARNDQTDCSDIDVMLVGDVTMREVSPAIRSVEKAMGRNVNPVIYRRAIFIEKLHAGDAFLTQVLRQPKIPILSARKAISKEELDVELRAMADERVAAS